MHPCTTLFAKVTPRLLAACAASLVLAGSAARAADNPYEVKSSPVKATLGEKAMASVNIATKTGWHLNDEAPLTLKLTPGQGITVEKPRLVRADLAASTDTTARFDVALVASKEGQGEVQAEAGFVICQETLCRPIREKLVISVKTSPAPAPEPAKKPAKSRKK
ncbi:MAG TPA: hypothetical protein VJ860_05235 [Polyangia bacterium]|jgi:hypothetical protein|nr:hypothetical protein [Polyangia bacterium]